MPERAATASPADAPAGPDRGAAAAEAGAGTPGRWRARLLAVVATVLVLAFLRWAQVATMPLAFGVFLAVLLWARTVVAILQGVSAWLVALLLGLDFALVWGLIAALLNFIPSVGSVLAVIPPTLFATVQFDGWARPLGVLAAMAPLQIVLGYFVDPKIEGRFLRLSPLFVLFSIVFWGWLWGVAGALLGVPIMVALVIVLDELPQTRWLAAMLVRDPPSRSRDAARGVAAGST